MIGPRREREGEREREREREEEREGKRLTLGETSLFPLGTYSLSTYLRIPIRNPVEGSEFAFYSQLRTAGSWVTFLRGTDIYFN